MTPVTASLAEAVDQINGLPCSSQQSKTIKTHGVSSLSFLIRLSAG